MKDKIQPKVTTCVPQMSYFALNSSKIASFWGLRPQTPIVSRPPANIFGIHPYGPPLYKILGAPLLKAHVNKVVEQPLFEFREVSCFPSSVLAAKSKQTISH